jgi:glycine/serine hydroxymethyltransferase
MGVLQMEKIAELIEWVLRGPEDTAMLRRVKEEVRRMALAFPLYPAASV